MALKRGLCHLAGSHLLDTGHGSTISPTSNAICRHFAGPAVCQPGDPGSGPDRSARKPETAIEGIEDLAAGMCHSSTARAVPAPASCSTTSLRAGHRPGPDQRLRQRGVHPHGRGRGRLQRHAADAGLGIYAAARALNLDFVPVVTEQYDLVVPDAFFETRNFQVLLETIRSAAFKKRVEALGGYGTAKTGEILL
jgi:putative molybdopterin biosynthesis protein